MKKNLSLLLVLLFLIISCSKDETTPDDPAEDNVVLVSQELIDTISNETIQGIASAFFSSTPIYSMLTYADVQVYKTTYRTLDVSGNPIIASGLVLAPLTNEQVPIISFQHGTQHNPNDAMSNFDDYDTNILGLVFASSGYAISFPDYLGYGETKNIVHPYEHAESLGQASFDMLLGTKELLEDISVDTSDALFLTGYSEGGYATMALHKHIEENSSLEVTMSAPGAGAYDKTNFALEILNKNEDLNFLPHYMWVLYTYNEIYNLNRPWSSYVKEPYATTLANVAHPGDLHNATITKNPDELFQESFVEGIYNGTDLEFLNALAANDIYNWTPNAPITLYHGEADDYVFPLNSESALNQIAANGGTISLVSYPNLNHSSGVIPYVLDVFMLFEALK